MNLMQKAAALQSGEVFDVSRSSCKAFGNCCECLPYFCAGVWAAKCSSAIYLFMESAVHYNSLPFCRDGSSNCFSLHCFCLTIPVNF